MKTCSSCKALKNFSEFSKNRAHKDGFANQCKPCFLESNRKTRAKNPEKYKIQAANYWASKYKHIAAKSYKENKNEHRDYKLRSTYGISLDEYNKKLKAQNECCAICARHKSKFKQ